jgi:hypothetical protein
MVISEVPEVPAASIFSVNNQKRRGKNGTYIDKYKIWFEGLSVPVGLVKVCIKKKNP